MHFPVHLLVIFSIVASAALDAVQAQPENDECLEFVGHVELAKDRTIVVTYYPPLSATQRIRPRERVYPKYFAMLDKNHPEERKYLLKLDGSVAMQGDRALRIAWERGPKGEKISQPRIEILASGAKGYEALLDRVHGLQPGETKVIPTRTPKCAARKG